MREHPYSLFTARLLRLACAFTLSAVCGISVPAQGQSRPVLLTEGTGTSTRAVAFESVTRTAEPFNVNSVISWSTDNRTRVMLFALNLPLLAGEGTNAVTADAEDASGRIYPLAVEYVGQTPGRPWLYSIIVRLNDEMTDTLGDVLVSINLHGTSSNRVRIAVGRVGGGPPDDAGSGPSPAPPTPPAPVPAPTPAAFGPGEASSADATRLLEQATWGPTSAEISRVQALGLRAFVDEQLAASPLFPGNGSNYPDLNFPPDDSNTGCPSGPEQAVCNRDNYSMYPVQVRFFKNAMTGQDQLRQRVSFALHQIFVVSGRDLNRAAWMTEYLQILDRNAFGNFRTLMQEITLSPSMGDYLDMMRSTRTNQNENFSREILQLFSIGVDELNLDGTPKLDAEGRRIPTYTQDSVNNFTRVFTGWNVAAAIAPGITNYRDPMIPRGGTTHDTGAKTLLKGAVVPACTLTNAACAQQDLNAALDNIFNHPNVGPFIGKQLIQHLVTSNPTPAYVGRVAAVFNDDCTGLYPEAACTNTRGNLRAVVRAVLLDPEARGDKKTDPNFGRLREPVQYINNILRAFDASAFNNAGAPSDGVLGSFSRSGDLPGQLDQPVFQPVTVFSYYSPDYEVPGARILGPAFAILSTSTTLRRANIVNTLIYTGVGTGANNPAGTQLNLTPLESVANDPQQLVNRLDALLLHGTMSSAMRTAVVNAVAAIPLTDSAFARKRAQAAVYLVATSPQYDVQR